MSALKTMGVEASVHALGGARTSVEVVAIALDTIKQAFGSNVGAMVLDRADGTGERDVFGVSNQALEDYIVHWRHVDRVFSAVLANATPVHHLQVYSREGWDNGPIMRGYGRPHRIAQYMSSPIYGTHGQLAGVVNFCRPVLAPAFEVTDLQRAGALSGFISAALARIEFGVPDCTGSETDGLSPRELQIARLACAGRNNLEIALRLGLARETVKQTLRRVYRKLDVTGRAQMATVLTRRAALDETSETDHP